jgi:hypothetical protein
MPLFKVTVTRAFMGNLGQMAALAQGAGERLGR